MDIPFINNRITNTNHSDMDLDTATNKLMRAICEGLEEPLTREQYYRVAKHLEYAYVAGMERGHRRETKTKRWMEAMMRTA